MWAAFYAKKERRELPGFSKNLSGESLGHLLIGIESKPHNPLRAPGKLRSDLELTIHWIFAQVRPQAES